MRSKSIPTSSAHATHAYAQPQQQDHSYSPCQHAVQNLARLNLIDLISVKEDIEGTHFHYEPEKNRHFIKATVDENNALSFGVRAKGDRAQFGTGRDMFVGLMQKIENEGLTVERVKADWQLDTESVNAQAFRANLAQGMGPRAAAKNTWTGQRLAEYGFRPSSVEQHGYCYNLVFKKG
jgi:hypothetical protein